MLNRFKSLILNNIKHPYLIIFIIIIFTIILNLYWFFFGIPIIWAGQGNIFVVSNESSGDILDVNVIYKGGQCVIDSISAKDQRMVLLNPEIKSGISIKYTDNHGVAYSSNIDVLIDPKRPGTTIIANIDNKNQINWKEYNYNLFNIGKSGK